MKRIIFLFSIIGLFITSMASPVLADDFSKEPECKGGFKVDEVTIANGATTKTGSFACCVSGRDYSPAKFGYNAGTILGYQYTSTCSQSQVALGNRLELGVATFRDLFRTGKLKPPPADTCSDFGSYTYVAALPGEPTQGQCVSNSYPVPTDCSQFPTGLAGTVREQTEYSGGNIVKCCISTFINCGGLSCEQARNVTRSANTGNACLLGYLNMCNDAWHTKSGDGKFCQIDKTKLPEGSTTYFSSTDFQGVCGSGFVDTAIGCIPTENFPDTMAFALRWLFLAAGGIIVALVIKNGFTLLTSAGNPEKLKEVRESVAAIVTGVLLIIFSLTILRVVGADILGLPGF